MQHDMDASPLFPQHEVPLYGRALFDTDARMTAALHEAAVEVAQSCERHLGRQGMTAFGLEAPAVHAGLVVSGDRFVSTTTECLALRQRLPAALAVEMEGAAVAQVCHDLEVPFAMVRTISDRADDDAHVDFTAFIREVASRYSGALVRACLARMG